MEEGNMLWKISDTGTQNVPGWRSVIIAVPKTGAEIGTEKVKGETGGRNAETTQEERDALLLNEPISSIP